MLTLIHAVARWVVVGAVACVRRSTRKVGAAVEAVVAAAAKVAVVAAAAEAEAEKKRIVAEAEHSAAVTKIVRESPPFAAL